MLGASQSAVRIPRIRAARFRHAVRRAAPTDAGLVGCLRRSFCARVPLRCGSMTRVPHRRANVVEPAVRPRRRAGTRLLGRRHARVVEPVDRAPAIPRRAGRQRWSPPRDRAADGTSIVRARARRAVPPCASHESVATRRMVLTREAPPTGRAGDDVSHRRRRLGRRRRPARAIARPPSRRCAGRPAAAHRRQPPHGSRHRGDRPPHRRDARAAGE